jgi:hypothetical protein
MGGRGGYNGGRGQNKSVQRSEFAGEGQKEMVTNLDAATSDKGDGSDSSVLSIPQAETAAAQPNLSQGTTVDQVYIAKSAALAQKGKNEKCFRCNLHADHVGTDCTAVLCIYCDSAMHKDEECHLLAVPKPTAFTYGLCREDLMWFELPKSKDLRLKNNSGKVCRIRVTGNPMTIQ